MTFLAIKKQMTFYILLIIFFLFKKVGLISQLNHLLRIEEGGSVKSKNECFLHEKLMVLE
jgi:hypothetical protein